MSLVDQFKIKKSDGSYILYDASIIADPALQLFDADYHTNQETQQNNSAEKGIGRAKVVYFSFEDKVLVLKHYYRGGVVARFIKDRYLGLNTENSRAFKEWRLLKYMRSLALPVPDAVAAHVKKGLFFYRADLVTVMIENSKTLAEVISEQPINAALWKKVGACIKRFHQQNIYHADLNARNILLTDSDEIYLIDFDNSCLRQNSENWKMANLARLKRSLLKFKRNMDGFNFTEGEWEALLKGYR